MTMTLLRRLPALAIILALAAPPPAAAQAPADVWRSMAVKLEVGTDVNVRLRDGQRFRATLVRADEDALWLQPRTRATVPVQAVPYDAIASLERREGGGIGAGKAAAIGVAAGVGSFFALLAILFAAFD
jgi:hypothetical protein